MAFSGQNNSKETISTNTRGYQFANSKGFDPSTFNFGYWNDMISFRFNPALEPSKQTEKKIFDYEKNISTALTLEKASLLLYKICTDIIPAIKNDEEKTIGVQVGGDSLLVIGTGKKITGSIRPYIGLHKSLNPDTKKPEMSIWYEFKTSESIDNYDEKTGKYVLEKEIRAEFDLFIQLLKSAIAGLGNSVAHSDRSVNRFFNDKRNNIINNMAEKMGVSTGSYNNNYKTNNFSWHNDNSNNDSSESTNVNELNDLADLSEYIE